jgi:DNA-binding MarR family transcriptional regulator
METKNGYFVSMATKKGIDTGNSSHAVIIGKLMSLSGLLRREADRLLLPLRLNQQQFSLLFEIFRAGKVSQKEMINRLRLEKAHVSKIVKKLQAMGLITAASSPEDGRSALLSITERGRILTGQCREIIGRWRREKLNRFNDDELRKIVESLSLLQEAFEESTINRSLKNEDQ